jgi:6,7-dimethyl-8-ribityllumazine synthase
MMPQKIRLAIVVSLFNEPVTSRLLEGALVEIENSGLEVSKVPIIKVPGALEIPLAAQRLAQLGIYDAILALGAVIRGETSHYDLVCSQVAQGCAHVALQNDCPVIFSVLTTENEEQAFDRLGGKHGHKGKEGVQAAIQMVASLKQIG